MVNTNLAVQKDGKEPPANIVIQNPSPVPPARKGQQTISNSKGKTTQIQKQEKESPQAPPIQNGHSSPPSQTVIMASPQQQQQQKTQQQLMPTKKTVPQQNPQKQMNGNMSLPQKNSVPQGNHINGTKTQPHINQPPKVISQNPTQQVHQVDSTNSKPEKKQSDVENLNSQVIIPKLPVDGTKPPVDVTKTQPNQTIQQVIPTVTPPVANAKLPSDPVKQATDGSKPEHLQSTQQTKQIRNSPVPNKKLPVDTVQSSTNGTNPPAAQPIQQAKQITNSPVPNKKLPVDTVQLSTEGTNPPAAQPIEQAKQFLGQHITRKISQTQPPLTDQQVQQISKSSHVENEKSVQAVPSTTVAGELKTIPNDIEVQNSTDSGSNKSEESSGQYPKSIVKVAQNVLKSPLVKTKRPRDISATKSPSMPSNPTVEANTVENITSSPNQRDKEKVNSGGSLPVVMKIPPKYDSRGNAQSNDPPKLGDLLQRASKSCPSSPEIIPQDNVSPTTTVIVTPATPISNEHTTGMHFKNTSQGNVTTNQITNHNQGQVKEVIQNPMQFPAIPGKQGGGGTNASTFPENGVTNIGGSNAEKSSILERDEGLLTPAVPGQDPTKIPGLITPPPSPPILSSLEEEERNEIAQDISETSLEPGREVTHHRSSEEPQLASERKEMSVGEPKEKSEIENSQIKVPTISNKQQPSQESTNSKGKTEDPNLKKKSEQTTAREEHLLGDTAIIKVDDDGNCLNEGVVLGKITLGPVTDKTPRPDTNNNASEYFSKLYGKELSSLEAKFEEQVQQLKLALSQKQEELAKSKAEAEKLLKQSEERSKREQQELKERSKKEQEELKERLEREKRELEEKHKAEKEERDQKELEERRKREEEKEIERKAAEAAATNNESNDTTKDTSNDEENQDDEEESEEECNRRKIDKLQMELLTLKQQNEEFEEMVREKHRRQIELELQIGEIGKEVTAKEAMVDSVKVELCYAKNETELTKARVKRMEEELAQYKEKVESLEQELDTAERELKRMEILQEKLQVTEAKRNELQTQLDDVELERDEEIKIIQDALDEAAQEREELLTTFEKEIEKLNSVNAAREAQMLEDFEAKLLELEKQHKAKLEEKERQSETTLTRGKRQPDQEEIRQRIDKMKSELNSEWEDKLRNECSRLKGELDTLHIEEKHLAVESIKVQKEQELQNLKKTFESKTEEMNKEISTLKESLSTKDAFYHNELDEIRTRADRDLWEMRRKLQKLDESSYDRQQYLEDKHREDIERLREEYVDKMAGMESQLSSVDFRGISDVRAKLEKMHKEQMEHLEEQHRLSMERLRDELEAEKFQAAEEARVIVTKHHEYINTTLREQLTEAITANTQYREEIDAIRFALSRREEVIRSLEEEIGKLRSSKGVTPPTGGSYSPPAASGGHSSSSPFPHEGSQGSRSSQDRLSTEGTDEDGHRASGLLGKVFGGGWFSGTKAKDNTSPGYNNSAAPSKKPRSSS